MVVFLVGTHTKNLDEENAYEWDKVFERRPGKSDFGARVTPTGAANAVGSSS